MGCCLVIGILAASPRLILFGMWLFTDYLTRAGLAFFWGLIGFIFVPCTTIAYSIAQNSFGGLQGWGTRGVRRRCHPRHLHLLRAARPAAGLRD